MRRTPITKTKTKRLSAYDRDFTAMKPLVLERSKGFCEAYSRSMLFVHTVELAGVAEGMLGHCTCFADHVHHRKYRSRGGTNSLSNLLHTCHRCHEWIHSNSELSNALGLSLHAGESEIL